MQLLIFSFWQEAKIVHLFLDVLFILQCIRQILMEKRITVAFEALIDVIAESEKLIKQLRSPNALIAMLCDIALIDELSQLWTNPWSTLSSWIDCFQWR